MNLQDFLTPPVIWFLIGLVLFLLELAIPGLIIIFFGMGAWITSLCVKLFDIGIDIQLFIFLLSSIIFLALLRKYFKNKFFSSKDGSDSDFDEEFIGKFGISKGDLKKGVEGKIEFKGTSWNAISDEDIGDGEQVKITGKESITLHVTRK